MTANSISSRLIWELFLELEDQCENYFDHLYLNRDGQVRIISVHISTLRLKKADGLLDNMETIVLSFKDSTDFFNLCNQNQDQYIIRFEYMSRTKMEIILKMDNRPRFVNQMRQPLMVILPHLSSTESDGQQFYINQSEQPIDQLSQSATITNHLVYGQKK